MTVKHIGGFFGWDGILSSVVLWVMVGVEGRRAGLSHSCDASMAPLRKRKFVRA